MLSRVPPLSRGVPVRRLQARARAGLPRARSRGRKVDRPITLRLLSQAAERARRGGEGPVLSSTLPRAAAARSAAIASRLGAPWTKIVGWLEHRDWDEGTTLMVFALVIGAAS